MGVVAGELSLVLVEPEEEGRLGQLAEERLVLDELREESEEGESRPGALSCVGFGGGGRCMSR